MFTCHWQVLAHVKEKHHREKWKCAELQATFAKAQEQLQIDKERARSVVEQRLKRKTRQMKLQETKLLQDPILMAKFQVLVDLQFACAHNMPAVEPQCKVSSPMSVTNLVGYCRSF